MAMIDSLTSFWKLDETSGTRADAHSSNDLTDNNTVTYDTGKINNAAKFTAANSESLSHADNAPLSITGDLSLAGWVQFTSLPTSGNRMTFAAKNNGGGNERAYVFLIYNNSGTYQFQFLVSSDGLSSSVTSVNWTPSTGTLYHIAVTYDVSAHTAKFYVNGSQQGSDQDGVQTSIYDSAANFRLGATDDGFYLDGLLDEWGVWSKVLTSGEASSLYNSGSGLAYPFTGAASQSGLMPWYFRMADKFNIKNRILQPRNLGLSKPLHVGI